MKSFFDSKGDKLTEKAFTQSLLISIFGFVFCVIALCSMTFAWFSSETSSSNSTLTSGSFDLVVTVKPLQEGQEAFVPKKDSGTYTCELKPGLYHVTLNLTPESTVKGRCIVTIGTQQPKSTIAIIGKKTVNADNRELTDGFTFEIEIKDTTTTVTFTPCWGEAVNPDIEVPVNTETEPESTVPETTAPETTEPETTEPETTEPETTEPETTAPETTEPDRGE